MLRRHDAAPARQSTNPSPAPRCAPPLLAPSAPLQVVFADDRKPGPAEAPGRRFCSGPGAANPARDWR